MAVQTSIMAYRQLDRTRTNMVKYVICQLLDFHGNLTDSELCSFFSEKGKMLEPRVRRNELMKEGIVYRYCKRICSISNKVVVGWALDKKKYWRKVVY